MIKREKEIVKKSIKIILSKFLIKEETNFKKQIDLYVWTLWKYEQFFIYNNVNISMIFRQRSFNNSKTTNSIKW